jgi:FkbM family methyltransferase
LSWIRHLAGWNQRFWLCWERLGLRNTLVIFFLGKVRGRLCKLRLPGGLCFHFEGGCDGVACHFYLEGVRIEEGEGPQIRKIVDGGANIGAETARFLLHHPQAQVAAIEAAGRNFGWLSRSFEGNPRVRLFQAALWPEEVELRVRQYGQDMQEFRVESGEEGEAVPAITIPQVMDRMGWEEIDILKLDIEGAEYELFTKGAEEWVGKVKALVFEVPDHERPGTTQAIFEALRGFRYNAYVVGENLVLVRQEVGWTVERIFGLAEKRYGRG